MIFAKKSLSDSISTLFDSDPDCDSDSTGCQSEFSLVKLFLPLHGPHGLSFDKV